MRKIQLWLHSTGVFALSSIQQMPVCTGSTVPCPTMKWLHWHSILGIPLDFVTFLNLSFSVYSRETITHPYLGPLCQGLPLEILIWNVMDPLAWNVVWPGILPRQKHFHVPKGKSHELPSVLKTWFTHAISFRVKNFPLPKSISFCLNVGANKQGIFSMTVV